MRILKGSGRLPDFFLNPQRFLDAVAATLKAELHRLIMDGIKYERVFSGNPDFEWQMEPFKTGRSYQLPYGNSGEAFSLGIRRL